MSGYKVQHCEYSQNIIRKNSYDLSFCKSKTEITFIRVEDPESDFLKNQGAKFVIQSFKGKRKILFTGLIHLEQNYYYGDNIKPNGKKDFLIVYYSKNTNSDITIFFVKDRNPRNKVKFANEVLKNLSMYITLPHQLKIN